MDSLAEQFSQAGMLMLVGMLVVFTFLGMLVVIVSQMSKLAEMFPDREETHAAPKANNKHNSQNNGKLQPAMVAAISAAVSQYRQNNKVNS